jgi:hypothetical protein
MANLKPSEAAKLLNVSVKTLQRWDRDDILKAGRTATNRRIYTMSQIQEFKKTNLDTKEEDFILFYYGGGIPTLDDHLSGKAPIAGVIYSKNSSTFAFPKDVYNNTVPDWHKKEYEGFAYKSYRDFAYSILEDRYIKLDYGIEDETIDLDLQECADPIADICPPALEDLKKSKDFAVDIIKEARDIALDNFNSYITASIERERKRSINYHSYS